MKAMPFDDEPQMTRAMKKFKSLIILLVEYQFITCIGPKHEVSWVSQLQQWSSQLTLLVIMGLYSG